MRSLFIAGIIGLFATNVIAFDQKEVQTKIEALRAKEASGQSIKDDLAKFTEELTKESQSLVVTHKTDVSLVDKEGKVILTLQGQPKTTVLANSAVHNDAAAQAVSKDPHAKMAHDLGEGAATLGGSSKKKKDAPAGAEAPAPTTTSSSSGGFGGFVSQLLSSAVSVGTSVVSGVIGGIL